MKNIKLNKDICIGCGACIVIDDEHFNFDDEGKSEIISNENLESANLTNAIESCPVGAIAIDGCNCDDDCECGCKEGHECNCEGCKCNEE